MVVGSIFIDRLFGDFDDDKAFERITGIAPGPLALISNSILNVC